MALEHHFQNKAVFLFEKSAEDPNDTLERGYVWYLCGELHRRLGNWAKARHFFEKCEETAGFPKRLAQYAKEQKKIVPK